MTKFTQIAAAGQTIYLIDENGKAWCVEYYDVADRERWQEIVHPHDKELPGEWASPIPRPKERGT